MVEAKKEVLFVDDDNDILETIELILEESSYTGTYCKSIEEALSELENKQFSCIVVDINLDGRNGAEVISYMRNNKPLNNHKAALIIMSGFIDESFIEKFNTKIEGVLPKPFTLEEIQNTLDTSILKKTPNKKVQIEVDGNPVIQNVFDPDISAPFKILELEKNVQEIILRLKNNSKLVDSLQKLKLNQDPYILKHIGLIINISTALSKQLHWSSSKTLEKFIYAAYLHDISLGNVGYLAIPQKLSDIEFNEDLSEEEKNLVKNHPSASAKLVESIPSIPDNVISIIQQHHERPDGSGFPFGIVHKRIQPLSTLFIISHDLAHYIIHNERWSIRDLIKVYDSQLSGFQFKKILRALEELI